MQITHKKGRTSEPLYYEDIVSGEVYRTDGGAGAGEPDGALYFVTGDGALVNLAGDEYYPENYANSFDGWQFWPVDVELTIYGE